MNADQAFGADIVDVCGLHFDLAGWEAYLMGFARQAPGYLRKFGARFCAIAGADSERYSERLSISPAAAVAYLVECGGFETNFDHYTTCVRAQGVSHQILHGYGWPDRDGRDVNEYVARCAAQIPDLFSAWAHVPLADPEASARQLDRCVKEWGMTGLSLIPFFDNIPISDPRCRPVLEKANELGLPIWLHGGQNFNNRVGLDVSHIRHIDLVAAAYPDLVILIGHGGWPWISDAVAICQRHDNVYLEFSSHRPLHMPRAGSGWEAMLSNASATMRSRVMFGTSGWVSAKSIAELAIETRDLPIAPAIAARWLAGNARRTLNIDGAVKS